jgi:hypothetical protein
MPIPISLGHELTHCWHYTSSTTAQFNYLNQTRANRWFPSFEEYFTVVGFQESLVGPARQQKFHRLLGPGWIQWLRNYTRFSENRLRTEARLPMRQVY